jgi:hypothetical protein
VIEVKPARIKKESCRLSGGSWPDSRSGPELVRALIALEHVSSPGNCMFTSAEPEQKHFGKYASQAAYLSIRSHIKGY